LDCVLVDCVVCEQRMGQAEVWSLHQASRVLWSTLSGVTLWAAARPAATSGRRMEQRMVVEVLDGNY
jgi:hypothetical protein